MTETHAFDRETLIALREQRRWPVRTLGTVAGVDARTIARMEDPHAARQVARALTLERLARALDVPVKELAPGCPEAEHRPRPRYNGPRLKWNADRPEDKSRSARRRYVRQRPVEAA